MPAFASRSVTTSSSVIIPTNPLREAYVVQNPSGSGQTAYINEDGAAVVGAGSIEIPPGQSYTGAGGSPVAAIGTGSLNVTVVEY